MKNNRSESFIQEYACIYDYLPPPPKQKEEEDEKDRGVVTLDLLGKEE